MCSDFQNHDRTLNSHYSGKTTDGNMYVCANPTINQGFDLNCLSNTRTTMLTSVTEVGLACMIEPDGSIFGSPANSSAHLWNICETGLYT